MCWLTVLCVHVRRQLRDPRLREFSTDLRPIPAKRCQHTLDSSDELCLVVRRIVRFALLVSQRDPVSRCFLVVDDYVLDVLDEQ